jgi:TRAP-type mannitol/chloroaromatic compound transport system permease small subunit
MLLKIEKWIDRFTNIIGGIATVTMFLMLVNVFYDAIMRYFFNTGSIALQEMEWHLFSVVFMFGIAYALKEDGHVRVDILYDRWSPRTQAIINIAGTLLLLIPLSLLIVDGSIWFVHEAYQVGEISGDPGGLTQRWLIKAVIPVSFVFLVISSLGFLIRNFNICRGNEAPKPHTIEDNIL